MIEYEELIKNINVLLVDDDEDFINIAYVYLKSKGYHVDCISNGKDAVEVLKTKKHQILLLDYFMPDMSGEDVINAVREFNQQLIIVLQTGFSGQKPPIETMQKLNIQNYHDKTEGMDKLNLELISAVKIFNQQNQISIEKFRTNAIGKLISSIATNIKLNLMSIGAGLETANMLLKDSKLDLVMDNLTKINNSYDNNKVALDKIDKVLSAMIKESSDDDIVLDEDIIDMIQLILSNILKEKGILLEAKACLRTKSYLSGNINDIIFVVCELVFRTMTLCSAGEVIQFILTEDESHWYFVIKNAAVNQLNNNDIYIFKNIVLSISNADLVREEDCIKVVLKKK